MKTLKIIGISLGSLMLLVFVGMKLTGITPIGLDMHAPIHTENGIAINGYDPVAYHTMGKATPGQSEIQVDYRGVIWNFHSEEHKTIFESNPDKYIPVVGGYCLFAASAGFSAPSDPEFWTLKDGRLMLYSDQAIKEKCEQNLSDILFSSLKNWK